MENTSRRDLLAGLVALPAAVGQRLLGLPSSELSPEELQPRPAAPGRLRVNPPSLSVKRRG